MIGGELYDQKVLSIDFINLTSLDWYHLEFPDHGNVKNLACVMNSSGFIIMSGGIIDGNPSDKVLSWDIVNNQISKMPDLNVARYSHGISVVQMSYYFKLT